MISKSDTNPDRFALQLIHTELIEAMLYAGDLFLDYRKFHEDYEGVLKNILIPC